MSLFFLFVFLLKAEGECCILHCILTSLKCNTSSPLSSTSLGQSTLPKMQCSQMLALRQSCKFSSTIHRLASIYGSIDCSRLVDEVTQLTLQKLNSIFPLQKKKKLALIADAIAQNK